MSSAHVVIIGGGPIGLAHAIGIKKLNSQVSVTVYEKYPEYQRKHTLVMQPQHLKDLMTAIGAQEDKAFVELLTKLEKDQHIRTSELEDRFKQLAIDNHIEIIYKEVDEESITRIVNSKPDLIIGADGTHSTVDRCLFAPDTYLLRLKNDDPASREQQIAKLELKSSDTNRVIFYIPNATNDKLTYVCVENGKITQTEENITIKAETVEEKGLPAFTIKDLISALDPAGDNLRPLTPAQTKIITTHTTHTPKGNQIKTKFDYVLQLRYEIQGEDKAEAVNIFNFYQDMARQGIIATEYVGSYDAEKRTTPITMQMMISREDFELLENHATSKTPIKPFENKPAQENTPQLPKNIRKFIYSYLARKVQSCYQNNDIIDKSSVRISVNEAPATQAEQIFKISKEHDIPVVLVGDAGLGLSYFKGLNAGLAAAAELLKTLSATIKDDFSNDLIASLERYKQFFATFAKEKVASVANYSTYKIRLPMKLMATTHIIKDASSGEESMDDPEYLIADYLDLQEIAYLASNKEKKKDEWSFYPHRAYGLVKFGQFEYVSPMYTVLKIVKQFKDYFKPYKSNEQLKNDFRQPLKGGAHVAVGVLKMLGSFFKLDPAYFADGLFTAIRGTLELAATPLAWIIKPLTRGLVTALYGRPHIEENAGMKRLVKTGRARLQEYSHNAESTFTALENHKLMAICHDMHRKFAKSLERGQHSQIEEMEEHEEYVRVRANKNQLTEVQLLRYFSLFSKPQSPTTALLSHRTPHPPSQSPICV